MATKITLKIALSVVEEYAEKLGDRKTISTLLKELERDEKKAVVPPIKKSDPYARRSGSIKGVSRGTLQC